VRQPSSPYRHEGPVPRVGRESIFHVPIAGRDSILREQSGIEVYPVRVGPLDRADLPRTQVALNTRSAVLHGERSPSGVQELLGIFCLARISDAPYRPCIL